jgi:hypothetical protein
LLILYRFGTIFRQVIYREVNYCEVFRKGELISKNPLAHLIYNEYKSYIPEEAKIGCPLPPRVMKSHNFCSYIVILTNIFSLIVLQLFSSWFECKCSIQSYDCIWLIQSSSKFHIKRKTRWSWFWNRRSYKSTQVLELIDRISSIKNI